jgi:prepilin-type N-terminal cleavage/methylation domain-containing protein
VQIQIGSKSPRQGFTLVELMVALSVLAILLAAAAPSFADFFERYRLRSAVDDTVNLFAAARQGAVEADRNVKIKFAAATTNWCAGAIEQASPATLGDPVPIDPAPCACDSAPVACVVGSDNLVTSAAGRGVTISPGGTVFTFDSKNGTLDPLASQQVDFQSSSGRYGLAVQVSALGQARACITAGKRPIPGYRPC